MMKTSKTVLLFMLIGLFIVGGVSAQNSDYQSSTQENVDSWLSSSVENTENTDAEHTISAPTSDPKVGTPVGDSLFTFVLLSGLYLLWSRKRNKYLV